MAVSNEKASMLAEEIALQPKAPSENGKNLDPVNLAEATQGQRPPVFSKGMLKLWTILATGYFVSTMNGYDGSLMGSVNAMTQYQKSFDLTGAGSTTGLIFIIYNLGNIAAFPVCGFLADGYGRRWCIFIGCLIVLVGTAVQTAANTQGQFMGGRFVLGFGAAIASAAAPAYIVEIAHPSWRGLQAGMYNNFWWLGNIVAGWTTYGTDLHIGTSWAWRVPTLAQCFLPSITMIFVLFFPESPRWLIAQGRHEEAVAIFAKYHAEGDENAPIVRLQLNEIVESLQDTPQDNHWWDFRELSNTRAARYRLAMVIAMAFFGQWSGNNVVSYFMPQMFKQAGITNPSTQLLLNAINPIFSMIASIYGASLLDNLGRRKMLLIGLFGGMIAYCFLTAFTAESAKNSNLGYGVIVSIYIFGIFFAWGWTPLQALYGLECLENRTRAKGSGLNFLFLNIAMVVNTYGISVGIEKIGWKLYIVYIAWQIVEFVIIYFFFVETAGKTLEELAEIFEAKNPRNASIGKTAKVVGADESGRKQSGSST